MLRFPPKGSGTKNGPAVLQVLADRRRDAGGERTVLGRARRPAGREQQHRGHEHARRAITAPAATSRSLVSDRAMGTAQRCTTQAASIPGLWSRPAGSTTIPLRGSLRVPRQAVLRRATASRCPTGEAVTTVDEAVAAADAHRLPGRGEGPGAGGRARQGRRHQARRRRRRGPHPRRRTSSAWTSRATSSRSSGSSRPPTSPRSTTPRSRSTARPRSTSACCRPRAASRSSGGRGEPRRHRQDQDRPGRRAHRGAVPRRGWRRPSSTPRPPTARSTSC